MKWLAPVKHWVTEVRLTPDLWPQCPASNCYVRVYRGLRYLSYRVSYKISYRILREAVKAGWGDKEKVLRSYLKTELKKGNETILGWREVEASVWQYQPLGKGTVCFTVSGWLSSWQAYAHWPTVEEKCMKCLYVPRTVLGLGTQPKDKTDRELLRESSLCVEGHRKKGTNKQTK